MTMTDDASHHSTPLQLRLAGEDINRIGVNIHYLGRCLLSSQELLNISANDTIKRDIPLERYIDSPSRYVGIRRFFVQGHLRDLRSGSIDLLVFLVAQPELRMFLASEDFRSFGIRVLANLVTSASFILGGRWKKRREHSSKTDHATQNMAIQIAPALEKLARCITPRGGIGCIELTAEETVNSTRIHLRVERGSRERVLDFAESTPASEICVAGEIRSVDLDRQRATIVDVVTGNRVELQCLGDVDYLREFLGKRVNVAGKIRASISRGGDIMNRIEVDSITPLDQLTQ